LSAAAALVALAMFAVSAGCGAPRGDANPDAKAPAAPELAIDLAPEVGFGALLVTVRVAGPVTPSVRELRVAKAWADTHAGEVLSDIEARDAAGKLEVGQPSDDGQDRVYPLLRAPEGTELTITYRASGRGASSSNLALRVGPDQISGVGHSFLLLPPIREPMPAVVRWHINSMGQGVESASSLGVGAEVRAEATSEELAHAAYVAGPLAVAEGKAGEKMVLLGKAELDVGAVLDWTARVRGIAARVFEGEGPPRDAGEDRFLFLLVAQPGMGRSHDGAHLSRSFALWFDGSRALDPTLRIAITHELVHRWIGASVRLDDERGRPARWFAEGFTVHYARRLLFDEKLITPKDFAEDLRRTIDPGREVRDDAYRRGALYAAHIDAAIRDRSRGKRSLDHVVRELLQAARDRKSEALPATALRDLVVRELGEAAGEELDEAVVRGTKSIALPNDAFGPCIKRRRAKEMVFDLGFDPASLRGDPGVTRGVVKGSAAARAGLRDGLIVLDAKLPDEGDPDKTREVEITVAGNRGARKIRFMPLYKKDVVRWAAWPCKR
jgi:predicted metalloprotease with PDZ domain